MAEQGEDTRELSRSARFYMFESLTTNYPNTEGVIPLSRQPRSPPNLRVQVLIQTAVNVSGDSTYLRREVAHQNQLI